MERINTGNTPQRERTWNDFFSGLGSGLAEMAAANAEASAARRKAWEDKQVAPENYLQTRAERALTAEEPVNPINQIVLPEEGEGVVLHGRPDIDTPETVEPQNEENHGANTPQETVEPRETVEPQEIETPSGTDIANEATAQATLNAKQQDYLNKQMRYAQGLLGKLQQPQAQTPIYDGRFGNTYNKTDLSSDEFYAQQYNNLRNAGLSDRRARREAARRAGEYRLQRISNINNAFNNFGLDDNGAVNPLGNQLIAAMGREDANQANVMHSLYPGLLDAYKARTAENIARMNNENKMALADARLRGQLEAIAARQANKQPSLNDIVFYSLLEQGYSPEQAYAFMRPNKTRDGGVTSNEEKLTPTVQGKQQGVFNLLVAAQEAVQNGDKNPDVDGDAIEAAREAVNDAELHGYLKPEQIARSRAILDNLVNQREVKYGYKPKY